MSMIIIGVSAKNEIIPTYSELSGFARGSVGQLTCYEKMSPLIENLGRNPTNEQKETLLEEASHCGPSVYSQIQFALRVGDWRFLEQQMK